MTDTKVRSAWLNKIAKLAVDRASGDPAPHKPILLLVVCELAEQGELSSGILSLTGELAFRFAAYWTVVAARRAQKPDIRLPFFHLKSQSFWQPLDKYDALAADKKLATHARLNEEFLACVNEVEFRRQARLLIITTYFRPAEQVALESLVGVHLPPQNIIREQLPDFNPEAAAQQGREARFRLTIVPAYDYTCALTRYRLVTVTSGSIVDGAHIHQFADSRNNDPTNGIALCKNAHWLFDQGLWSLTGDYRVLVAHNKFEEMGPSGQLLREFEGRKILLPREACYWPSLSNLAWHRQHHGYEA